MASEIGVAPQLECSVKGAGGDHPPISWNVASGYFVVVPAIEEEIVVLVDKLKHPQTTKFKQQEYIS